MKLRDTLPFIGMPLMLLTVQIGALLLSPSMKEAGYAAFEDPSSVTNPLIFIAILLIFTAFLLILIKKGHLFIYSGQLPDILPTIQQSGQQLP